MYFFTKFVRFQFILGYNASPEKVIVLKTNYEPEILEDFKVLGLEDMDSISVQFVSPTGFTTSRGIFGKNDKIAIRSNMTKRKESKSNENREK